MSLLGPVPGIVAGMGLVLLYLHNHNELMLTAANMFLFINLFNLLPFNPLDGFRVLEGCLFVRKPKK